MNTCRALVQCFLLLKKDHLDVAIHIAENRIVHTFELILCDVHRMLEMCLSDVARKVVMGMWFHRIVVMGMWFHRIVVMCNGYNSGKQLIDKWFSAVIASVSRLFAFATMYNSWFLSLRLYTVIDMPEQMRVGEFLPPYYISQLEDSIIISGSFSFGDCRILYAWDLQVDDGEVSSYRQLFTIPYPYDHELKLLGFSKDKQPIVKAAIFQQWHQSPQVFNLSFQTFQNVGVEVNRGSFFIGPYKESLMLLNEQNNALIN
ncbi:hypothetical protein Tco_1317668 [Tanacetum coccineum]